MNAAVILFPEDTRAGKHVSIVNSDGFNLLDEHNLSQMTTLFLPDMNSNRKEKVMNINTIGSNSVQFA